MEKTMKLKFRLFSTDFLDYVRWSISASHGVTKKRFPTYILKKIGLHDLKRIS